MKRTPAYLDVISNPARAKGVLMGKKFRRSKILAFFSAVVVTFLLVPIHGELAAADTIKCSNKQNNQVGWATNQPGGETQPRLFEGASADIVVRASPLCTTDTNGGVNFSNSWVMLFGSNGYFQTGFIHRYGATCAKEWVESDPPPGGTFADFYGSCPAYSTYANFKVESFQLSVQAGYRIRGIVDSNTIHTAGYGPQDLTARNEVEFAGETYYPSSNVPGLSTSQTNFQSMQIQDYNNDNFYTTCGNVNLGNVDQGNTARYSTSTTLCNSRSLWTG